MKQKIEIKRAAISDIDGLNKLLRQVLEVHHKGRPDIFKGGVKKYTDEQLKNILGDDHTPVFAAFDNGELVGYAFCVFKSNEGSNVLTDIKTIYIDDLCVDEAHRGSSIGKTLYEYVLGFAKANGCYNITLNVWSCNPGAVKFYEAMGMKPQKIGMEKIL